MRYRVIGWINNNNLVLIFILCYILFSIIKLQHPGVNNDQLMFVNTATFNPDNSFLWKSYQGIPLMVFPYIGALKSYLYMPIFYIFGVNIYSIRLPHIIITAISLFLVYKFLSLAFEKKMAIITILFLSLDPSHIAYSKIDTGPTVVEFFFKVLAVFLLYKFVTQKRVTFLLIVFPVLALGLFNKLNFFWFINAFLISFLLIYGWNFFNNFKGIGKLTPILIILIPYLMLLKLFLKLSNEVVLSYRNFTNEVSLFNLFSNLPIFITNLSGIVNGNLFFQIVYGEKVTMFGDIFSISYFIVIIAGVILIIKNHFKDLSYLRSSLFFLAIFLIMSLQIIFTKRAVNPWHYLSVYPFLTVLFALGIVEIYKVFKPDYKKIFSLLIIGMVFYLVLVNLIYLSKYSSPTKAVAYSSSIYELVDYARNTSSKFICLDVDICNQLLSLSQQTGKYYEKFGYLDEDTYQYSFSKLLEKFNDPENYLYISHGENTTHVKKFRQALFSYLKKSNITFIKVKEITDGQNVAFEVYKIGYF